MWSNGYLQLDSLQPDLVTPWIRKNFMHSRLCQLAFPRLTTVAFALSAFPLLAGEVSRTVDKDTGWDVYTLRQGVTQALVVPAAGANAFSIVNDGVEYLRVPEDVSKLRGVGYGVPILYPMPNRVRDAEFEFEGKQYRFPKNGRGNFIHGLVHSEAFKVEKTGSDSDSASITCSLTFTPGAKVYELFPLEHVFRITVTVRDQVVRWTYDVDNANGNHSVPFGVGFHPYFVYQNSREQTFLTVPAKAVMTARDKLPTGDLVIASDHPLGAQNARSLKGYHADDVFFGMTSDQPASVEFREAKRRVTLVASPDFTHLVVWTPDRRFFGIENQTCSTDAHNLASKGRNDVAHLQVCLPGKAMTGMVEYQFRNDSTE
jgi:aldose 1-epimerase